MGGGLVFRGCPGTPLPPNCVRDPKPTAFLDRDGVLNVDHGYVARWQDFEWSEGALQAVDWLRGTGYRLVVVTNQSGIGRGYYTEADFLTLTQRMLEDVSLDAVVYCPHIPDDSCPARKPLPGMLQAVDHCLGVERAASFLVGDKESDMLCAQAFGIAGHRFAGGNLLEFLRLRLAG